MAGTHQPVIVGSVRLVAASTKVRATGSHPSETITLFNLRLATETSDTVWRCQNSLSNHQSGSRILKLEKPDSSEFTIFTEHLRRQQGVSIPYFLGRWTWDRYPDKSFLLFEAIDGPTLRDMAIELFPIELRAYLCTQVKECLRRMWTDQGVCHGSVSRENVVASWSPSIRSSPGKGSFEVFLIGFGKAKILNQSAKDDLGLRKQVESDLTNARKIFGLLEEPVE